MKPIQTLLIEDCAEYVLLTPQAMAEFQIPMESKMLTF